MSLYTFIISFIFFNTLFTSYKSQESDNYFLLYPSEDKSKPYQLHILNSQSQFFTLNSTDEENMKFISSTKTSANQINHLSSIFNYNNRFLIKTCLGPNKIIEIIDENSQSFTPINDAYFNNIQNNLANIKFCYSAVMNIANDFYIITYWTESSNINGKETYSHKLIKFNMKEKVFSEVKNLNSKYNFYAESCTTLGNKYIYCTIDPSFSLLSNIYDFTIDSQLSKISTNIVIALFTDTMYHRPIGLSKETYTLTGKTANYFLTEYHDKGANKTRLVTSLYVNKYSTAFILKLEGLGIYHGINIEDRYVDPNLFNHILTYNNEILILYVMKGAEGKNLLLVNQYDYTQSLQIQTKFNKYSLSNYLRDDICDNPKYMQSIFILSYINYDENDKQIIKSSTGEKYYTYQRDIGIVMSCAKDNGDIFYEAKKIVLPQCLNILENINTKTGLFTFKKDSIVIKLDIKNNPNLKSLRNVEIQFFDSNIYNVFIIVQALKDGKRITIDKATTVYNVDSIEIFKTLAFKEGKSYQIPYRIKQTGFSGISSTCHLTSDICYIEVYHEGEEDGNECTVKYCKECENNKCIECNKDIIGIKLDKSNNLCVCDEEKGSNKEPNLNINMCTCKEGYSFYQNINTCLPDSTLNNGTFCISEQDERSSINIYDKITDELNVNYINDLPYCPKPQGESCNLDIWFKMGRYIFYWAKVDKCIYIIYNHEIVIYSDRAECQYKNFDYRNCFNLDINNREEYEAAINNAYEYIPNSNTSSFNKTEGAITFYILNEYNINKYSSVQLSKACMNKVKEVYNIDSLLIFVVNIKKSNIIATQVEYGFYNPNPEKMNEKLNMSICFDSKLLANLGIKRQLQYNYNSINNIDDYDLDIDEIIINVQIDWPEKYKKSIDELYIKQGIDIFNSSNPFFNDVCYTFTTPEGTDLFLQDRKEKYFINDPLCESNCVQLGYDVFSERAVCKCKMKEEPDNYENVTFVLDLDENFKEKFRAPNLQVLKCLFNNKLKWNNAGNIIALILIIIYLILFIIWIIPKTIIITKNKKIKEIDGSEIEKPIEFKNKINNWEIPFKDSLDRIKGLSQMDEEEKNEGSDEEPEFDKVFRQKKNDVIEKSSQNKRNIINNRNNNNNNYKNNSNENSIGQSNDYLILKNNRENNINASSYINKNNSKFGKYYRYKYENDNETKIEENNDNNSNIIISNNTNNNISNNTNNNITPQIRINSQNNIINSDSQFINQEVVYKREEHKNASQKKNKSKYKNEDGNCCDELFEDYLYKINKKTRTHEDLVKYKKEENLSCILMFLKLFFANYFPNSSPFFIIPWCTKVYKESIILKLLFLILIITLYMIFNIFTEVNTSTLHVISNHVYEEDSPSHLDRVINFFFPFIVLFFPIAWIRKSLFKTQYIVRINEKIKKYEDDLNKNQDQKDNTKRIELKKIESDIEKTQNNYQIQTKLVFIYGGILLFINWILVASFCGIYTNSSGDMLLNTFISILWSILFSLLLNAAATLCKYFDLFNFGIKLSEFLNLKKFVNYSFNECCCYTSYFLCFFSCSCCKEEFNEEEETIINDINDINKNEKN